MSQFLCANLDASGSPISTLFGYFLSIVVSKQCSFGSVTYPQDRTNEIFDNHVNIDFIVVGSGSSGSVMATRLSEVPEWNVLLIEAGKDPTPSSYVPAYALSLQKTSMDWAYVSEKQPGVCEGLQNNVCNIPRGKGLGGSSNINNMLYVVGNPKDYNSWGSPDWNFENFEKYFHKSFNDYYSVGFINQSDYFNTYGMIQTILCASKELHLDKLSYANGNINPNRAGTLQMKTTITAGERLNTAKAFLAPVKDRENLFVMKNTIVTKILLQNKKATGVQILKDEKYYEVKFNKELILTAGSVNTPKLLFQSGIGDEEQLKQEDVKVEHHLPSVGNYLYDHNMFLLPIALNISSSTKRKEKCGKSEFNEDTKKECNNTFDSTNIKRSARKKENKFKTSRMNNSDTFKESLDERTDSPPGPDEIYNYIMTKTGFLGAVSITDYITFLDTTRKNPDAPDVMLDYMYFPKGDQKSGLQTFLNMTNWNETMMIPLLDHPSDLLLIFPMLMQPRSYGNITFTKNVQDKPKIFLNYFHEKEDFIPFIKAVRFAEKLVNTKQFKKYGAKLVHVPDSYCDELFPPNSDDYWKCSMKRTGTSFYHLSSTCRMGNDTSSSVVNYKLLVHGLENVRIADASVMPYIVRANLHATCMAIAEKCADLVKKDWT